jgi:glycosyltransferase involved in cell wall biosynthesis
MNLSMQNPRVSVIVPVYNAERYLGEALESVMTQRYTPLEVIVVDDGSTDNSAAVAQEFPVQYFKQANGGPGAARNFGIARARGEFVAFQDADDVWTPDKLLTQVEYLRQHPEVQYVVARAKFFLEPGASLPPALRKDILQGDYVTPLMQTLLARREVFDVVGLMDPTLSPADDVDWFARANDLGVPMAVVDRVLLHKRLHDDNISLDTTHNLQMVFTALRRSSARKRELKQNE